MVAHRLINTCRVGSPPPVLRVLGEQFIRGELTPNEFRQACFAEAKKLAKNPDWQPVTGPVPE